MPGASRKEEERNERVVRGLLKLPPNRRCINCNGIGPQYVCTSFWTFVCISCSGIHREFTHRVKSVSMSTFTTQEVEALQNGGNQRARESFLKEFDAQKMRLPDSSNVGSLRAFIKSVYVERRYAGGRFSERPPRDKQLMQNQKNYEEEHRRASSYHSFSQSPPYDYQYDEIRNGRQPVMLTRRPGSDREHDGKIPGFYSPQSTPGSISEDRFANESCGSRTSDCSGSSIGDAFRSAPQSPKLLDDGCFSPSIQHDQSNIQTSKGTTQSQITKSAGNVDSTSVKSGNSSLADMFFESDNAHRAQQTKNFVAPSFTDFSDIVNAANNDLFSEPVAQQKNVTALGPHIDLFAEVHPTTPSADRLPPAAPSMENAGWATFDTPPEEKQLGVSELSGAAALGIDKQALSRDLFLFEPNDQPTGLHTSKNSASVTEQSAVSCKYTSNGASISQPWIAFDATNVSTQQTSLGDLPGVSSNSQEPNIPIDRNNSQLWHSFDDASGIITQDLSSSQLQTNDHKDVDYISLTTNNPFTFSVPSKESHFDDIQNSFMDGFAPNDPLAAFLLPSPLYDIPSVGTAEQTPLNPFDQPLDSNAEAPDMFMDVSALQAALPNADLPTSFLDGLPETWFSNSASTCVPSGSLGGLPCLVEQVPNSPLRSITLRSVSAGNPFA